ncbi:MAG: hypothetical protein HDT33_05380 [Clostridiales bacterium]|nr:hypothetical protein [Clostridiales bacterium]
MKIRCALLAAALALLLAGCQVEEPAETASVPPDTAAPVGESVPSETPSPALDPLEELLAQYPIDDDHDAFLVDTGGRLGTLLVTVELGEREQDLELRETPLYIAIWDPEDMSEAIQEMESTIFNIFHWHAEVDANFDGYMDFSYTYAMGNQPCYAHLWIWDEDVGQFVEVPEYAEISMPYCDPETETIDGWARESAAGDGVTTFHRWEDGELVCVRRIETYCPWEQGVPIIVSVQDRVDGELKRVYYEEFPWELDEIEGREAWRLEASKWGSLDYHGET